MAIILDKEFYENCSKEKLIDMALRNQVKEIELESWNIFCKGGIYWLKISLERNCGSKASIYRAIYFLTNFSTLRNITYRSFKTMFENDTFEGYDFTAWQRLFHSSIKENDSKEELIEMALTLIKEKFTISNKSRYAELK